MREFDRLPPILRAWLADAVLPWRPRSVRRAFNRALESSDNPQDALAELERLQSLRLAEDVTTEVPS